MAARTAYEEAILQEFGEEDTGERGAVVIPSYMVAADTHNIANRNQTFAESVAETIQNTPKFIGLSIISGANQLYNIPANLGNLFGADIETAGPEEFIASLDSDLARYYEENQDNVDLVGFLASSWIPGMAGIKALNAGQQVLKGALQANRFGANTSKALGLLVPDKQINLAKALRAVANNDSVPSLINRNVLAATGKGLTQATYEAAAFEIFVATSMSSSPIMENQDLGDLVTNIAWGAGLFGVVSGGASSIKNYYATKTVAKLADRETSPWRFVSETPSKANPYEAVAINLDQLDTIPAVPKGGIAVGTDNTLIDAATLEGYARAKVVKIENSIREQVGKMAQGDEVVAEAIYSASKGSTPKERMATFMGLKGAIRVADKTPIERELAAASKAVASGTEDSLLAVDRLLDIDVAYTRLWGAGAGKVLDSAPKTTSITDLLKKGQKVAVDKKGVAAGTKSWKFDPKASWSVLHSDPLTTDARYIWAENLDPFRTPSTKSPIIIDEFDIPMMEKAIREFDPRIKIRAEDGSLATYSDKSAMFERLTQAKQEAGVHLADARTQAERLKKVSKAKKASAKKAQEEANVQLSQDEIESMVNVKTGYLSGTRTQSAADDVLARQSYAEEYTKKLVANGSRKAEAGRVNLTDVPQTVKLAYDKKDLTGLGEGHVIENVVRIKQQQKIYMQGTDRAFNSVIGEEARNFGPISAQMIQESSNRIGAGAGGATAASSNYGSLAAFTEYLGKTTIRTIEKAQEATREALDPVLYKLGQNAEAAVEYATLSNLLRSIPDNYVLNKAGDAMVPRSVQLWEEAAELATATGKAIPDRPQLVASDAPAAIAIKHKETRELIKLEQEINGAAIDKYRQLRTAQGVSYTRDGGAYYPIPVNPKDYKHFALVSDSSITGTGHTKTLYATSAEELAEMAKKLDNNPQLTVRFKAEAEEFYKARGQFEYEKTLSDNYLDAAMYRKGISSSYLVPTDPKKIVNDTLNWYMQRDSGLVREAVAAKYEVPFAELRRLGDVFTKAETSQFSSISTLKYADDVVQNPYADFIKTALGIRKYSDYPFLVEPNKFVDHAFTKMYSKLDAAVHNAKTPAELAATNKILQESGYKGAAYDESMALFANQQARKGELTNIVQKANSLLATVILRWDPLNAINNAVSANVLLGAETAAVMRAINKGDDAAIGALSKLTRMQVPGSDKTVMTAGKMIGNAMKRFGTNTPEMEFYRKHGYITSISDQYKKALDDLAFNPAESIGAFNTRVDKVHETLRAVGNTGEKWTGNRLAEEFNRFVAADVMKQMTDIAVKNKLMSAQEQLAYINTFVNRTQGNYLAAQRPMMFQGPIGQAIGLFQTYQFNLMQQLFRHIGEGTVKDSMSLLALQGTIHGMNGLPAFNAVNTHIVGTASGNESHKDLYDTVYGAAGKSAGDWLMYGIGSNALGLLHPDLKTNLYTRGDINPRHITIVPTDPSQVAIVQASAKFFANLFEVAGKIGGGGDIGATILQGLEHNGVSRPLAGLAQTLEALENPLGRSYSTSKQGNVIASNDLLTLANLTRIVGGKPFDEAIALDASFRFKTYGLTDARKRRRLGETMKTTMIAGEKPTSEQIQKFAEEYVAAGGKQEQFNQWFIQQYKTANLSQTNKISQDLNHPFSQSMQRLMGGNEMRDFTE